MKVLFLADHRPGRSPSQRFRWEQFIPRLEEAGIEFTYSYVIDAELDEVFYRSGHWGRKAVGSARALWQRWNETRASRLRQYDLVVVHRGAFFFGPPWIERRIARSGTPMVFDFDDAIWLPAVSEGNRALGWLKKTDKVNEIVRIANLVIAGNDYLAGFALEQGAENVEVIPTVIELERYDPRLKREKGSDEPVCIGWTGSFSTIQHFRLLEPVLERIKARFGDRVIFRVIGDPGYRNERLDIEGVKWREETEVEDLAGVDIGLMPLPEDDWSRGKCACKALQYMALGIPTVATPVGVNSSVIQDQVSGFLPGDNQQFLDRLSELIESPALRREIGRAGWRRVRTSYSTAAWEDSLREKLQTVSRGSNRDV